MDKQDYYRYATRGFHELGVSADSAWLRNANDLVARLEAESPPPFAYREGYIGELDWLLFGYMVEHILFNPPVAVWLDSLLGPFREIDHFVLHSQPSTQAAGPTGLHGPARPYDRRQHHAVKDGRIYETMVVVSLSLVDVNPGDGGLAVIPGSHMNPMAPPDEIKDLSGWPEKAYPDIHQVPVRAGGVVLFTEALQHGTLPWRGEGTRRTVFAKCCARGIRWAEDRRPLLVEQDG